MRQVVKTTDAPINANDEHLSRLTASYSVDSSNAKQIYIQSNSSFKFQNFFQALQLKIQGLFKYFQGPTLFSSKFQEP